MIGLPEEALAAKYAIRTHYIVRVLAFYPETQTVDVIQDMFEFTNSPLGDITIKNELGQTVTVGLLKPSILYNIPVQQLRWGQFSIQAAPQVGDTGYIEVFTNDISEWVKNGGIAIPSSDRRFAKESCVFVPFVANDKTALTDYVSDGNTLVIKSQNASITLTDNGETSDVSITANTMTVTAQDGVSITGDVSIDGDVSCTKTITADTDVVGGGVSLKNHKHPFTYSAGEAAGTQGETTAPLPEEGE